MPIGRMNFRPFRRAVLAAALLAAPGTAGAADVEWKYFSYFPPNDTPPKADREFAQEIFDASKGRFKINVFTAGELPYKGGDTLRIVATNQVQMATSVPGFVAGEVPALNVLSLPFLCTSFDAFDRAVPVMHDTFQKVMDEKFDVKIVMHWTMPSQNIWLNKDISSFAELDGAKVRVWSPIQTDMLAKFGASSVSITSAEVVPALDRRVIDGAITSALSANDWKSYSIIKTGYMVNFMMGTQFMLANGKAFRDLPEDLQKILVEKSQEWAPKYRKIAEAADQAARDNLAKNGVNLKSPSDAEMAKARELMRPIWDEWAAKNGEVARSLLEKTSAACAG